MNPMFFGRTQRQLYGVYHAPDALRRDQALVFCPAFGTEYLFAHSTARLLGRQLADAGYHVLRFDYSGMGDSAGDFEDATPARWTDDINTAIAEVKDLGQVSRVGLIGLRYGAALAAQVAAQHPDVDQLVLWDPVTDGRAFLAEIGAGRPLESEAVDACGVAITPEFRGEIECVSIEAFALPLPRTLIVATDPMAAASDTLARRLRDAHVEVDLQRAADEPAWRERQIGIGAMAVATVRGIVSWLT